MAGEHATVFVTDEAGITIIGFAAEQGVLSTPTIEELGPEFLEAIEKSMNMQFIISFEGVEYMSSMVLGTLVAGLMRVQQKKGALRIAGANDDLVQLFQVTGLHRLFTLCKTVADAKSSF